MPGAGATAAAGRCRIIAALPRDRATDGEAVQRLIAEARNAGADGVKLVARCDAASLEPADLPADRLGALLDEVGDLDIVIAPYDLEAARAVAALSFAGWKIDAPLLTHLPLIAAIVADGRPVIAGVAGCTKPELDEALCRLPASTVLMHTVMVQQDSVAVVDVAPVAALRRYGRPVGYADTGSGADPALVAVSLGATIVEKPLAVARGGDADGAAAGLAPHEFRAFVARVRAIEDVLGGDAIRDPRPEELDLIDQDRVAIVAQRPIARGAVLTRDLLTVGARGPGLPPRLLDVVEGRRALYDIPEGAVVTFGLIEL